MDFAFCSYTILSILAHFCPPSSSFMATLPIGGGGLAIGGVQSAGSLSTSTPPNLIGWGVLSGFSLPDQHHFSYFLSLSFLSRIPSPPPLPLALLNLSTLKWSPKRWDRWAMVFGFGVTKTIWRRRRKGRGMIGRGKRRIWQAKLIGISPITSTTMRGREINKLGSLRRWHFDRLREEKPN